MRFASAGWLVLALTSAVHASDLVTRSGQVYRNYRVVSHDVGFITILDNDGGSRIPLADLPADLQKKYGYDPAQASAYVTQFEAADRQQQATVLQAEVSDMPTASAGTTPPVVSEAAVAPAPASEPASAPLDQVQASSLDLGQDPLSSDAQALRTNDDAPSQVSYAYDSDGSFWVSSVDSEGMIHWYRNHSDARSGTDGESRHLDGVQDIPDGAVLTTDQTGHMVVTYFDPEGHMHSYVRSAEGLSLDRGAWHIHVDPDGRRVATRDVEETHPHDLRIVQQPTESDHRSFGTSTHPPGMFGETHSNSPTPPAPTVQISRPAPPPNRPPPVAASGIQH